MIHQAVSSRSRLLPTIANSLFRIYRLTLSDSLKRKVESLQHSHQKVSSQYQCCMRKECRSQEVTEVEIQAHLWLLLQREMNDICLWPRRNKQILHPSKLKCKERQESSMLDESLESTSLEQDLDQENLDDLLDTYVSPTDESFNFDEEFFNIDEPYGKSSAGRDINIASIDEGFLDEDAFWAPLDDEAEDTPTSGWSGDFLRIPKDNDNVVCENTTGSETTLGQIPKSVPWDYASLSSAKAYSYKVPNCEIQDCSFEGPFNDEQEIILDQGISVPFVDNTHERLLNKSDIDNDEVFINIE